MIRVRAFHSSSAIRRSSIRGTATWCVALATGLFAAVAVAQPPLTWTVQSNYFAERNFGNPRTIRGFALNDDDSSIYMGLIQSDGGFTQVLRKVSSDVLAVTGSDNVMFGNGAGPPPAPPATPAGLGPVASNPVVYPPTFTTPGTPGFEAWTYMSNEQPRGIATDDRDNVYVTLRATNVVRIYNAGLTGSMAQFPVTGPLGVSVVELNGVYWAYVVTTIGVQRYNVTALGNITLDTTWVPPLALNGNNEGNGIEVDADGTVYVAAQTVLPETVRRVHKISPDGTTVTSSAPIAGAAGVAIYQDKIYVVARINPVAPIRQLYKADLTSAGSDIVVPDFSIARGDAAQLTAIEVSADGRLFVSEENYTGTASSGLTTFLPPATSFNPTPSLISGRIYFDRVIVSSTLPPNAPPIVTSPDVVDGGTYEVKVGETFDASFLGTDPEGFDMTLTIAGDPQGSSLVPASGTTSASPFAADFSFSPVEADFNTSYTVTVSYEDSAAQTTSIEFTIEVPENEIPTVTAPSPVTVECTGGQNLVTLETTVDDGDNHPLTVTWFVDNVQEQQTTNVVPGSVVEFEFDYPDGVSNVEVEVTDGYDTASASTTVTVQDTTDPTIIVAADMIVPTDPGSDVATNVVLEEPQVFDLCDGDPTLTNDAPAVFPLGETIVTWTAKDADDNESTGEQKVTVVDRERPVVVAGADITVSVDPGEVFAIVDLPEPDVSDNVPAGLVVTDDVPAQFEIGNTRVTWFAVDAAGNEAQDSLIVTVLNAVPVADAGADISVTANSKAGIEVTLDGSGSSDADDQDLTFEWTAPGITFDDATSATPTATFPVGTTVAKLVVMDEAGRKSESDTVRIIVTYAQLLVINERYYGLGASPYSVEAGWRCQGLADTDPTNAFFAYADQAAEYALAFNGYAAVIDYVDSSDFPDRLHLYKYYRYYQMQYDFYAATYVYWGYFYSPSAVAYYDYVLAAYLAAGNAGYYGLADFDEP